MTAVLKRINTAVIDPDTRHRSVNWIYGIFALAMFMHHVVVTLRMPKISTGADFLTGALIAFAAVTFILGRMWKDKCFWILLALLLLRVFRIDAGQDPEAAETQRTILCLGLYAYVGCYGAGRVLKGRSLKRFVQAFCILWTVAMVVFSCFGVYTGWTGEAVKNLSKGSFHIRYNRLSPVYHFVEGGIMTAVGVAVAMIGFCISGKSAFRWLYVPAALVMFVCGALTATRTGYVLIAAELSMILCVLLYDRLLGGGGLERKTKTARLALVFVVFAALAVLLSWLQTLFLPALNQIRGQGGALITTALAEGAADSALPVATRGFQLENGLDGFLNGRLRIWKALFETIRQKPSILLYGESAYKPMGAINAILKEQGFYKVYHAHNAFLQLLLENGIPGMALFIAFIVFFLRDAFRSLKEKSLPLWQRVISGPALCCLLAEMVDVTAMVEKGNPQMTVFYLFIGLTVACGGALREKNKNRLNGR